MATSLFRKQLEQTRKELERDQRTKARERLKALKAELQQARGRRRQRMSEVGANCRAARKRISARARAARERLNEAIARQREQAKKSCSTARGEAQSDTLAELGRALGALELERGTQRQLAAWTRPQPTVSKARERRVESDDEVRANIDDPSLLAVFDKVKHRIKPKARTSRSEVFAEWVAENSGEVYRIQEAALEREIDELEREEYALTRALSKKRYRAPRSLAAVPF